MHDVSSLLALLLLVLFSRWCGGVGCMAVAVAVWWWCGVAVDLWLRFQVRTLMVSNIGYTGNKNATHAKLNTCRSPAHKCRSDQRAAQLTSWSYDLTVIILRGNSKTWKSRNSPSADRHDTVIEGATHCKSQSRKCAACPASLGAAATTALEPPLGSSPPPPSGTNSSAKFTSHPEGGSPCKW